MGESSASEGGSSGEYDETIAPEGSPPGAEKFGSEVLSPDRLEGGAMRGRRRARDGGVLREVSGLLRMMVPRRMRCFLSEQLSSLGERFCDLVSPGRGGLRGNFVEQVRRAIRPSRLHVQLGEAKRQFDLRPAESCDPFEGLQEFLSGSLATGMVEECEEVRHGIADQSLFGVEIA